MGFWPAAVLGILARESTLFLVPAWLATRQWRNLTLALIIAFVAWYVPRLTLSSDSGAFSYTKSLLDGLDPVDRLRDFVRPVVIQWGITGALTMLGLLLTPVSRFWMLLLVFLGLALGAFFSSLVAGDIGRLFELLFPIMIVSCAYFFAALWKRSPLLALLLAFTLAGRLFWVPTNLLPRESFVFDSVYPRGVLTLAHLVIIIGAVYLMRAQLTSGIKEKVADATRVIAVLAHKSKALAQR